MIQKRKLAATIKQLAADKNESIAALERYAGCSQGLISRWASSDGEEFSVLSKLAAIAEFLDVSLDELLGQKKAPPAQASLANPLHRLLELANSPTVQWHELEDGDMFPINTSDLPPVTSGRTLSDSWWLSMDDCYFVLSAYCDDRSDTLEPMDLAVHCIVGHGIPAYPLPVTNLSDLQALYVQLRIQKALRTTAGHPTDQKSNAPQSSNTISFERIVSQG